MNDFFDGTPKTPEDHLTDAEEDAEDTGVWQWNIKTICIPKVSMDAIDAEIARLRHENYELRQGILKELTEEAQELDMGY